MEGRGQESVVRNQESVNRTQRNYAIRVNTQIELQQGFTAEFAEDAE
jgi:hypothetical protein